MVCLKRIHCVITPCPSITCPRITIIPFSLISSAYYHIISSRSSTRALGVCPLGRFIGCAMRPRVISGRYSQVSNTDCLGTPSADSFPTRKANWSAYSGITYLLGYCESDVSRPGMERSLCWVWNDNCESYP